MRSGNIIENLRRVPSPVVVISFPAVVDDLLPVPEVAVGIDPEVNLLPVEEVDLVPVVLGEAVIANPLVYTGADKGVVVSCDVAITDCDVIGEDVSGDGDDVTGEDVRGDEVS